MSTYHLLDVQARREEIQSGTHLVDVGASVGRQLSKLFPSNIRGVVISSIHYGLWHVVFPAPRVDEVEGNLSPGRVDGITELPAIVIDTPGLEMPSYGEMRQ